MDWTSKNDYLPQRIGQIDGRREVLHSIIATPIFLAVLVVLAIGLAASMKPTVTAFVGTENPMASAETLDRILIDGPAKASDR